MTLSLDDLIDLEDEVDRLVRKHIDMLAAVDEDPFRLGMVAYHQSYLNLYNALVAWKDGYDACDATRRKP